MTHQNPPVTNHDTISGQIAKAALPPAPRRLALWLLEQVDHNGYSVWTPSQLTHILIGKQLLEGGYPGRVYGDSTAIHKALNTLCMAGILAFTWTDGNGWAQDVTTAFMAWQTEERPFP